MVIEYFHQKWMDGRMTPVAIPTRERMSLSEHNRKEMEQKQAHAFLDIKMLPAWASCLLLHHLQLLPFSPHSAAYLSARVKSVHGLHQVCEELNNSCIMKIMCSNSIKAIVLTTVQNQWDYSRMQGPYNPHNPRDHMASV